MFNSQPKFMFDSVEQHNKQFQIGTANALYSVAEQVRDMGKLPLLIP